MSPMSILNMPWEAWSSRCCAAASCVCTDNMRIVTPTPTEHGLLSTNRPAMVPHLCQNCLEFLECHDTVAVVKLPADHCGRHVSEARWAARSSCAPSVLEGSLQHIHCHLAVLDNHGNHFQKERTQRHFDVLKRHPLLVHGFRFTPSSHTAVPVASTTSNGLCLHVGLRCHAACVHRLQAQSDFLLP